MAVRTDASGEYLNTSTVVHSAWSAVFWFKASGTPQGGPFAYGAEGAASRTVFLAGGATLACFDLNNHGGGFGSLPITVGTWYRTAIVVRGTNCWWYRSAAGERLTESTVTDISSPDFGTPLWMISYDSFPAEWWLGDVANVKLFGAALTRAEVEAELAQAEPARRRDLLNWHPFIGGTEDYSGHRRALSGGVGAAYVDGPPIPWATRHTLTVSPSTSTIASATIAATLPALTASLLGDVDVQGQISGTLPTLTASMVGDVDVAATLGGTLPLLTASFVGDFNSEANATISAALPSLTASMASTVEVAASLAGTLPALTATMTAGAQVSAQLNGSLPFLTASATATVVVTGVMAGTLPALMGSFVLFDPDSVTRGTMTPGTASTSSMSAGTATTARMSGA